MNRADIILTVVVMLLALALGPAVRAASGLMPASTVTISCPAGTTTVPLGAERTLKIAGNGGPVVVTVHQGSVAVLESSCPDHVCVHTGAISRSGEAIVCVPNGVTVRVGGEPSDGLDAVAR